MLFAVIYFKFAFHSDKVQLTDWRSSKCLVLFFISFSSRKHIVHGHWHLHRTPNLYARCRQSDWLFTDHYRYRWTVNLSANEPNFETHTPTTMERTRFCGYFRFLLLQYMWNTTAVIVCSLLRTLSSPSFAQSIYSRSIVLFFARSLSRCNH